MSNEKKYITVGIWITFFGYLYIMLEVLLFKFNVYSVILDPERVVVDSVQLIPFKTILSYLNDTNNYPKTIIINNIIGNILIFIPLGAFLAVRKKKKMWISYILILGCSLAVECIQFFLKIGACDIDDIILNFMGGAIGINFYHLLSFAFNDNKAHKILFWIMFFFEFLCLVLIITLRINGAFSF